MKLATIRIHDTFVVSLACHRLDAAAGDALITIVEDCILEGARHLVLDFGPYTVIETSGARALTLAREALGDDGALHVAGLNARARAMLRSLRVTDRVELIEWWSDGVMPTQQRAA